MSDGVNINITEEIDLRNTIERCLYARYYVVDKKTKLESYVIDAIKYFVCLFVFLSAGLGLLQKCLSADFTETWCYDWAYINASAGNLGRSGSLFHFSQHCRIAHFRRLISISHRRSPATFHETERNERRQQGNESNRPIHFESDPMDSRIRINP